MLQIAIAAGCGDNGESTDQTATATTGDRASPSPSASAGGRIAFMSERGVTPGIYAMNAGGSGVARPTDTLSDKCCPTWEP